MPVNPTPATAITRPDLAAAFDEFDLEASRAGFVGLRVFPVFESNKQSATFKRRKIEDLLKEAETLRASGGDYGRTNWRFTEDSFATSDHGIEETVDDRESAIYADYFDAERDSAQQARDIVLRNHERRVAAKVFDTSVWTGAALTTNVTTPWSTIATATPIDDVRNAKIKIRQNSGLIANAMVINWETFQFLRDSVQIIDRAKYSGHFDPRKGRVSEQDVALALDLDELIVAGAQRNSANEAVAAVLAEVWNKNRAMVCRVATPGAPLSTPCIGRTIHWGEDGSQIGGLFETYRPDGARYQVVRARMETDEKRLYTQAGHLLTNLAP